MQRKVSIVIPLHNKGKYIARTIHSILAQTIQDFEIIIINDGSTDNGPDIVQSFKDDRIKLVNQDNLGVSAARNRGGLESNTNFIAFLDADDEWTPKHLETLLQLKQDFPEAGIFTTSYIFHEPNGIIRYPNYKMIPSPPWEGILPSYFKSAALGDPPVCSSSVGIPKNIFLEVGGFPIGEFFGEDLDLWARIALKYPVAFGWEGDCIYHTDADARVCNQGLPVTELAVVQTIKIAINKKEFQKECLSDLKEYVAFNEIGVAYRNILVGNSKIAKMILLNCTTKYHQFERIKWLFIASIPIPFFIFMNKMNKIIKEYI